MGREVYIMSSWNGTKDTEIKDANPPKEPKRNNTAHEGHEVKSDRIVPVRNVTLPFRKILE